MMKKNGVPRLVIEFGPDGNMQMWHTLTPQQLEAAIEFMETEGKFLGLDRLPWLTPGPVLWED